MNILLIYTIKLVKKLVNLNANESIYERKQF